MIMREDEPIYIIFRRGIKSMKRRAGRIAVIIH